jgi:hypothetical protein
MDIYNVDTRKVKSRTFNPLEEEGLINWELSNLDSGIYNLVIHNNKPTKAIKSLKE